MAKYNNIPILDYEVDWSNSVPLLIDQCAVMLGAALICDRGAESLCEQSSEFNLRIFPLCRTILNIQA